MCVLYKMEKIIIKILFIAISSNVVLGRYIKNSTKSNENEFSKYTYYSSIDYTIKLY